MQTLRITRYLDKQGRITLPNDFRKGLELKPEEPVTLRLTPEGIFITPITQITSNYNCPDCSKKK